jgi:hypothetical protein
MTSMISVRLMPIKTFTTTLYNAETNKWARITYHSNQVIVEMWSADTWTGTNWFYTNDEQVAKAKAETFLLEK